MSKIPTVTLNNGLPMPQIGLGVYKVEDGASAEQTIHTALDAGYRSIDTAMIYRNEESVGRAVASSDVAREDLFITSKVWNDDQGYDSTLAAFDASLERLKLDYLDLYLIHWPSEQAADTWKALEKLYADKRVKAIGVSNFQTYHLDKLAETSEITPMVNQVELHPMFNQAELREYCAAHDIQVESWGPLMQGGVALKNKVITNIAQTHGKTPAQVILRWHIQHNLVVIPKSVTPERIQENIEIFDFTLTEAEISSIDGLDSDARIGGHPDDVGFSN